MKKRHDLKLVRGGEKELGWIQPTCSCGWIGRKEYAYNDYQHSNVQGQESDHLRGCRNGKANETRA